MRVIGKFCQHNFQLIYDCAAFFDRMIRPAFVATNSSNLHPLFNCCDAYFTPINQATRGVALTKMRALLLQDLSPERFRVYTRLKGAADSGI